MRVKVKGKGLVVRSAVEGEGGEWRARGVGVRSTVEGKG